MRALLVVTVLLLGFGREIAWGCACGCGVFDVQTGGMLPTQPGGTAFLEYDFMNQNKNYSGASRTSDDNNEDKGIRTHFLTAGARYMFNQSWGIMGEVPFWLRRFTTSDDSGNIVAFEHGAQGDIRLRGVYTGFSPEMSSGLTFGAKLPTGDYRYSNFDRDTAIGTGSTDLLLGAFHRGDIGGDGNWFWFANAQLDEPLLIMAGYRPGAEVNMVLGGYYDNWHFAGLTLAPLAQIIGSLRGRDSGWAAKSNDSGYQRMVLSPGLELIAARWRVNASVGFPVYQYMNGNQLTASEVYKAGVSYGF